MEYSYYLLVFEYFQADILQAIFSTKTNNCQKNNSLK